MRHRPCLIAVALCLIFAGSANAAPVVGLSDQNASTFSDARVRALKLGYARLIVPYDAATSQPATVDAWLAATKAAGMEPHIAFEHKRGEDCSTGTCTLPSATTYANAVAAFRARWPQVTTFTAWNEANHVSQPTSQRPERAAAYYQELAARCAGCTIVAGDVLDSGDFIGWLRRFLAASPTTPQLWGLHNYGDVTYGGTSGTDAVLAAVPGSLWIEETGGIVTLRNAAGRTTLRYDESRAAESVDAAFSIAAGRPRIARMYIYHWRAGASERFDSGLVRPDGTTRPSLVRLVDNLVLASAATTTSKTTLSWRARWASARRSAIRITRTCTPAGAVCTGRVRGRLTVTWRSNGRTRTRTWAISERRLRRARALNVAVPAAARKLVARGRARKIRLRLTTTLTGDTSARRRTLALTS